MKKANWDWKTTPLIGHLRGKKIRWKSFLQLLYILGEPKKRRLHIHRHSDIIATSSNRRRLQQVKKEKRASEKKRTQRLKEVSAIGLYVWLHQSSFFSKSLSPFLKIEFLILSNFCPMSSQNSTESLILPLWINSMEFLVFNSTIMKQIKGVIDSTIIN